MKLHEKFKTPMVVSAPEIVFGGNIDRLMPSYNQLPDEFHSCNNKWCKIQQKWFFSGLPADTDFRPKDGIDINLAFRHIKAIHVSWQPKHEHKEAGVAYLLSLWFEDIIIPTGKESA